MAEVLLYAAGRVMSERPLYTECHPRWIRTRVSTYWWLRRWSYLAFILRELSCIFVGWFVVYLLLLVLAVSRGESRYQEFLGWSGRPAVLALNIVSLFFIVYHAITWFNLAPQAMVLRVGGRRVPGFLIAGSNYLAWAMASALVGWLLLGE
jgi:fumarate reductase subunit C